MKKFLLIFISAVFAVSAHAQFSGDGYYRVQNYSSSRYLAVIDPSGGRRGTDIDIAAVVGYGSAYVNADGTQVKYANDAERFSRVVWDPATVLYVKTVNGNSSLLDFYGQGIDTYKLTSAHLTVANSTTPGAYWAYGSAYGATLYLADNTAGRKGLADGTPICTHENGSSDLSKWNCKPINQNDGFYFGMKPTLTVGSDYYLTFYASFPFSFSGSNMHAYYVSKVDNTLGVAVYKEITDKVPESTPIFVKCASADPVNNKLTLYPPKSVSALGSTNLMKGTYFDCAKSYYHMHFVEYNPASMRILGVTNSGKLGFVKKPKEELNKLIGCDEIKKQIEQLTTLHSYNRRLRNDNPESEEHEVSMHAIFHGAPGTGKTTLCRLYASLLYKAGALSKGHVVVADRGTFVGNNFGDEEKAVHALLKAAEGGVLMIDEAYQLNPPHPHDPGKNVLPLMMPYLADESARDIAIVLCGYTELMENLLRQNEGLASRFPNRFKFPDFTVPQLLKISKLRIKRFNYHFTPKAWMLYQEIVTNLYNNRDKKSWGNAREVGNLLDKLYLHHAARCERLHVKNKRMLAITEADVKPLQSTSTPNKRSIGFK